MPTPLFSTTLIQPRSILLIRPICHAGFPIYWSILLTLGNLNHLPFRQKDQGAATVKTLGTQRDGAACRSMRSTVRATRRSEIWKPL
jgi:hypothetical protein